MNRRLQAIPTIAKSIPLLLMLIPFYPKIASAEGDKLPPQMVTILGPNLGATGGEHGVGAELNALALYRYHSFELGLEARLSTWLGASFIGGGGLVGARLFNHWPLHLLGAFGAHGYSGVGESLFGSDPGVSATLPYVGARIIGGHSFGHRGRFFIGAMALLDYDIIRVTRTSRYSQEGYARESTRRVGQLMGGGLLTWGVEFSVAPEE